ncbi:hypothetical protein [Botrimarina mediterranea]|uniref:Uncharacterized protein n=1 Tax=Botrimarina mediterranea TaxID=2528022 RepID=A0A518K3H9_9BACT|nr:hypothetical protein [Botrimarina mediterranea]QDV72305.1 hypothetical protein Spa11_04790 [Botrimarina mediterranea]QDV76849.1 hypothetical protein K2D_04320 [Planctomycetes bacterium K2D]
MRACPCQCRKNSTRRRWVSGVAWLAPTVALAVMPKCPACVVAYVAVLTGLGMSLTAAAYLRTGAIGVCLLALTWLVVAAIRRRLRRTASPAKHSTST